MTKGDPQTVAQTCLSGSSGRGVHSSAFGKGLLRTIKQVRAKAVFAFDI